MSKTAAVAFEVRYRKNSDPVDQWSSPIAVGADGHIAVPGLERVQDYTFEARAISGCGSKSSWATQTFNLPDAPNGTLKLSEIQAQVDDAADAAAAANTELVAIASDNILSPAEKPTVMRDYSVITTEQAGIDAQASSYGVDSSAYDNAITALTNYLEDLTAPTEWNDKSGNTTIVGPTFRSNFNAVYTARQTLLNAILGQQQAQVSGIPNPSFESNLIGAAVDVYLTTGGAAICDGWQVGEVSGFVSGLFSLAGRSRSGNNQLRITLQTGNNVANGGIVFGGAWTARTFPCTQGDTFFVGGYVYRDASQSAPAGVSISLIVQLRWYGASGYLAQSGAVYSGGAGGSFTSPITDLVQAPAGTTGYKVYCQVQLRNNSGAAITTNGAWCAASFDDLFLQRVITDQRNLPPINFGGVRSVLSVSPIAFSISGTTVTCTVAAFTLNMGGVNVSYNASSGSVSQATGTTVTYYFYYRDPLMSGGSKSLLITTSVQALAAYSDIVNIGSADVTVNAGGGGSGGTGGGGGGFCVADDMFIGVGRRAGDADIGDPFDCMDLPTQAGKHVRALQGVSRGVEDCVRMITSDGCALVCSLSTPFDLPGGRNVTALHMLGEPVITDLGIAAVTNLALVGPQPVTRAHLGGVSYAAGADPHRRIYSHNTGGTGIKKP